MPITELKVDGNALIDGAAIIDGQADPLLDQIIGEAGDRINIRMASEDANEDLAWYFTARQFPNAGAPHDEVLNLGWNVNEDGNPKVAGEPMYRDSWESNFDTGAVRQMERHWQYTADDGATTRRPLSNVINRATDASVVSAAGQFQVFDSTRAAQRILIADVANPASLASGRIFNLAWDANNHQPILRAQNTPFTANIEIIRLNNVNEIEIARAADANMHVGGGIRLDADNTPANLAQGSSTNNYAPAGLNLDYVLRQDITGVGSPAVITGLSMSQTAGRILVVVNLSTVESLQFTHEDVLSVAANRFRLPAAAPFTLSPLDSISLRYDGTLSRWMIHR